MHFKFRKERVRIRRCCTQAASIRIIPAFHHCLCGKKKMNANTCTTIRYRLMIEFVISGNSSKYLRTFHHVIVIVDIQGYNLLLWLSSNAEGHLWSQQSMWDVGWTKWHQNEFLHLRLRRFSPVKIIPPWQHIHSSVTYRRRYIILTNEVAIKKYKKESYVFLECGAL